MIPNRSFRVTVIRCTLAAAAVALVASAVAQSTEPAPATQPAIAPADQVLNQMLRGGSSGTPRPLTPIPDPPAIDRTSGGGAVAPRAQPIAVLREGTFLIDRVGRLSRSTDGAFAEFTFESDGKALRDPPVIVLPNLKLMAMETAARASPRDLKFRITGMVTEYNGRNYVLLEKVVVVPEQ
jgi:hypothetical protein